VFIDQGIGTTTSPSGSTSLSQGTDGTYTYTGTFLPVGGGTPLTCSATLTVTSGGGGGGGGCTSDCGGGGGGGPTFPNIVLSSLPHIANQPLAYLYLSQIPYTGLDLGTWGTLLYWIALIGWSLAAAYLVLFGLLPFLYRKSKEFGTQVAHALNSMPAPAYAGVASASESPAPAAARPAAPKRMPHIDASAEAPVGNYSTYDGFKSFASAEALSIDDIVKGLTRSAPKKPANVEPVYQNVEPVYENVEPLYMNVEPIAPEPAAMPKPAASKPQQNAAPMINAEVPDFIAALIAGDRETVFTTLRGLVQSGADSEAFIAQVALALDDAYRARTEGAPVHPEIKRLTAGLATPVLERLVSSLTSAVDSTYSVGITGAKLALTRALSILGA
jgi:hypothetical protein